MGRYGRYPVRFTRVEAFVAWAVLALLFGSIVWVMMEGGKRHLAPRLGHQLMQVGK